MHPGGSVLVVVLVVVVVVVGTGEVVEDGCCCCCCVVEVVDVVVVVEVTQTPSEVHPTPTLWGSVSVQTWPLHFLPALMALLMFPPLLLT
jgi:hypothetical protein